MSERGQFRGRGDRGGRGGRGGADRGGRGGSSAQSGDRKANIIDLNKYLEKEVRIKFTGGREGIYISNIGCQSRTDTPGSDRDSERP